MLPSPGQANFGAAPGASAGIADHARRIHHISASAKALRRRVDGLFAQKEHNDQRNVSLPEALQKEADNSIGEVKILMAELRPLATVAREFKLKWEKQKAQLLVHREAEIDQFLREESEAKASRSEQATQEELASISVEDEQRNRQSVTQKTEEHRTELGRAIEHWRATVPGADVVRYGDVDKALRNALTRVAAWAEEEEQHLMQNWGKDLSKLLVRAHQLDEEAMAAMEETQIARRAVLDSTLHRQKQALQEYHEQIQEQVVRRADGIHVPPEDWVRTPQQRLNDAKAMEKAARQKLSRAKSQASEAQEAHISAAVDRFKDFAQEDENRTRLFLESLRRDGPLLQRRLETELGQMAANAKLQEKAKNDKAALNMTPQQSVVSPPQSPPQGARASIVGTGRQSMLRNRQSMLGASGGVGGDRRASAMATPNGRGGPAPKSPIFGAIQEAGAGQEAENSEDSDYDEAAQAKVARDKQIKKLKEELKISQEALVRGDWDGDWRKSLKEVADEGVTMLHAAHQAFNAQAKVLKGPGTSDEDKRNIDSALRAIQHHSDVHVQRVAREFTGIRNMKVALSRSRAAHVLQVARRHQEDSLDAEGDLLPAVSRLAHEVEAALEVGHALTRGAERLPVGVIAGSWRRTVATSFPVLQRLWDGAEVPESQQVAFAGRLLTLLARMPQIELDSQARRSAEVRQQKLQMATSKVQNLLKNNEDRTSPLFFNEGSTNLNDSAHNWIVIDGIARIMLDSPGIQLRVHGETPTDAGLADARAAACVQALVQKGVPNKVLKRSSAAALGENKVSFIPM